MAKLFEDVNPGDLIISNLMNRIMRQIEALDDRVAALETIRPGDGAVVIDRLSGTMRLGDVLEVHGRNFEELVSLNTVRIDDTRILRFNPGSSTTRLVFNIPTQIQGVPKVVTLTVTNRNGSASTTFTLLPAAQVPVGALVIMEDFGNIGQINVGSSYTFNFILESQTTIAETYRLEAKYASIIGASEADWRANTELVDLSGARLLAFNVLQPFTPFPVGVKIKIPSLATSATLFLRAESVHNDAELSRTSSAVSIVVGGTPQASDPRVTLTLEPFGVFAKARLNTINGVDTVEVPFGDFDTISFNASFAAQGTYSFEAEMEPAPGTDWRLTNLRPSTPLQKQAGETEIISVIANLDAAANPEHTEQRTLVIKVRRTDTDSVGTFLSYIRMSIRGYTR